MNVRTILEVLAYMKEQRSLIRMRATKSDLEFWERNRLPIQYRQAFRAFQTELHDPSAARGLLGKALLGGVDPSAIAESREEVFVEDEWPWWRAWTQLGTRTRSFRYYRVRYLRLVL